MKASSNYPCRNLIFPRYSIEDIASNSRPTTTRHATMRFAHLSGHRWLLPLLLFSLLSFSSLATPSLHNHGHTRGVSKRSLRVSTKATVAAAAAKRLLNSQDENNSRDEGYDENGYNNNGDGNVVDQTRERVETDLNNMWVTSPSEWIDEYWEVLGVAVFLVLFILFICCAPICCCCDDNTDRRNVQVATVGDEIEGYNSKQEPILQQKKDERTTSAGAVILPPILSFDSNAGNGKATDGASTAGGDNHTEGSTSTSPTHRGQRKRRTLWGEVVSVWSEFLDEMMNGKRKRSASYYDYHLEEDNQNDGTMSPRRRRARERKLQQRRLQQQQRSNIRRRYDDSDYDEDHEDAVHQSGTSPADANKSATVLNSPQKSPGAYHPGVDSLTQNISNRERYDVAEIQANETPYDETTDHEKDEKQQHGSEAQTPQEKYKGTVV